MTRIIGVDPGLVNTGWGIIDFIDNKCIYVDSGVIKTNSKEDDSKRLLMIYNEILVVINKYKPQNAAIEQTYVNTNFKSSLKLAQARGAAILTLAICNLFPVSYPAKTVKKAITGTGMAEKNQIIAMLKYLMPKANIKSMDAADATAIAICHAHYSKY